MTNFDFSYKLSVALSLISLINLNLNMRTLLYLMRSYDSKLKTFLPIRLSIFYLSDILNDIFEIVILPSFRSFNKNFLSARSLSVMNDIFSTDLGLFRNSLGRFRPRLIN